MRLPNRLPEPGTREVGPIAFLAVTVFGAGVVGAAWLAAAGGAALSGRTAPGSLSTFFSAAMSGDVYWAGGESAILATVAALLAVGVGAGWVAARKLLRGRTRVDTKAKFMATAADMALLAPNGAQRDAERLGAAHAGPGVPLGTSVRTGQALRASWEWVQLYIMGPRAGKTTCVCIPQILETTGPVLVTSNKRDVVDLSLGPPLRARPRHEKPMQFGFTHDARGNGGKERVRDVVHHQAHDVRPAARHRLRVRVRCVPQVSGRHADPLAQLPTDDPVLAAVERARSRG